MNGLNQMINRVICYPNYPLMSMGTQKFTSVPLWSLVEIPVCDTHCENDEYYYFKTLIPFGASACNYFQNCTVLFLGIFFITVQKSNFSCAEFNPNEFKQ
jgi:hypothetical protein